MKRVSEAFPEAETIILIQDNLDTHSKASLYQAFEPEEARALARRFEIHYTPELGPRLNVQELAWSALERQALDQRVGDKERFRRLVCAWLGDRRERTVKVDWQIRTSDARLELERLYPQIIG